MAAHANIEQRASKTAMMAAVHRYLSLYESNSNFSTQDTFAKLFIPGLWKFFLGFAWIRRYVRRKLHNKVPGTYPYVIARTKCFDEQFVLALQQGVPQIVILGAGYDSRAIRYQDQNQISTLFELDMPALLENKCAILKKSHIDVPENLKLCPITFGDDDLAAVLNQAGFDPSRKTLFIWEGVSYYLTEAAVIEMLSFIRNHSCVGSQLIFDYFYHSFIDGNNDYYGAKEIAVAVEAVGEPFRFGIGADELASFLAGFGFEITSRYDSEALEQRYLSSNGELLGQVYGFAECVCATKTSQEEGS